MSGVGMARRHKRGAVEAESQRARMQPFRAFHLLHSFFPFHPFIPSPSPSSPSTAIVFYIHTIIIYTPLLSGPCIYRCRRLSASIIVDTRIFLPQTTLHPTVSRPPGDATTTTMTTTLERSVSRNSNISMPLSSPHFSIKYESTTPDSADPALSHVYDCLNGIDSSVHDIRSSVMTKEAYADRRNREDQHIRREFEAHRAIYTRIDVNVVALRTDIDQLKSEVFQVKSNIRQSGTDTALLRSDVDHLQKKLDQVLEDIDALRSSVSGHYVETSKLKASICHLRTEMLTLHHENSRQLKSIESRMGNGMNQIVNSYEARMDSFEARIRLSERVRFNSLANTTHAPISPVPVIDEKGSFQWPRYFPKTVWRFWCLKKRSRSK